MSKETRTIRPVSGLGTLPAVLEATKLRFGSETCLAGDGITVEVPPHEFLRRPVSVEWTSDAESFGQFKARLEERAQGAGFTPRDLALVVVASTPYLKIASVLYHCGIDELDEIPRVTDLCGGERPTVFRAPFSGFTVDVYVLLRNELEARPLRPYRLGTWVAHASFRVGSSGAPAVLPPSPLTDEVRSRLGLPAKTIRYVDFGDHDVLQSYAQQERPVFYVDEKLLAQLNARRTAPGSKALQLQLAHDFVSSVLRRAAASEELKGLGYEDLRHSLVGSALRVAAGPAAAEQELRSLVGRLREAPEHVVARAEAFIDLLAGYSGLLEEPSA